MSKKEIATTEVIQVCDLCGENVNERNDVEAGFQFARKYKSERPLKVKWYQALRYQYDGHPEYDVHHTCVYELIRRTVEAGDVR